MSFESRRLHKVHDVLPTIKAPSDLAKLTDSQREQLVEDIREHLIEGVSRTGGHLGPNLGVIELTIALHLVYESPRDSIVFDTGHISYVHKLLTGRQDFSTLRTSSGLSGYPSRAESDHDIVESSHASSSLAWAQGIARARHRMAEPDRKVVAVIGDGALTGGMAWEALNNIAADPTPMVVVVNDNERSYAPTIGGLADHLATLRTTGGYEWFLKAGKQALHKAGPPGRLAYETLHGVKKGLKDIVAPQGLFEDLGLKYIGPVDGHDITAMTKALSLAKEYEGPVIVHAITRKGNGYEPALRDEADQFHAVGVIDPETGLPVKQSAQSWTSVFADEIVDIARETPNVVGITAAMLIPVGLHKFAREFPDRVYDVGIAEQHAAAMAAGLSFGGAHPVVAVYSTFLNRAFDQLLMDCALHGEAVTFILDRAGITGPDGASHHGMWDLSLLQMVPNIRVAAPRDAERLATQVREAVTYKDGPTAVRFPKGVVGEPIPALRTEGTLDVLAETGDSRVLIVSVGAMAEVALETATLLSGMGVAADVVDPGWVLPLPDSLMERASSYDHIAVIEDGLRTSGVGAHYMVALADAGVPARVSVHGVPPEFIDHASRTEIFEKIGLTGPAIAAAIASQCGISDPRDNTSHLSQNVVR